MSTSELRADEKLCPYCAETIKRAAVKCRWCGSDLDALPAIPRTPATPATPEPGAERTRRLPRPALSVLTLALVLALVLASVGLVLVVRHRAHRDSAAAMASPAARSALLDDASRMTATALSYAAPTFDRDVARAAATMTPGMRRQYDGTIAKVRSRVQAKKLTVRATVRAAGVSAIGDQRADVLVFLNQVTTRAGVSTQQLDEQRVVVTLVRGVGDRWLIDRLRAF